MLILRRTRSVASIVMVLFATACSSGDDAPSRERERERERESRRDGGDDDAEEDDDSPRDDVDESADASSKPRDAATTGGDARLPSGPNREAGAKDGGVQRDAATGALPSADSGMVSDASGSAPNDAQAAPPSGEQGSLPVVSDVARPGPFMPVRGPGPSGYLLFYPKELGKDGVKHPIVSFGPGAAENAGSFTTLLNHIASHGFAVIAFDGTPQGQELVRGIDWMIAENERSGSMLFQKLDTSKVAAGGHSAGSLATFRIGADKRLSTTLHLCGGTFEPHTDIENLHAPALFLCGEAGGDGLLVGDVARPNCDIDFTNATVPVFYGIPKGASHMSPTEIGDAATRAKFIAASTAWLRFQLAGDHSQRATFVGDDCSLCKDSTWTAKQKNWP